MNRHPALMTWWGIPKKFARTGNCAAIETHLIAGVDDPHGRRIRDIATASRGLAAPPAEPGATAVSGITSINDTSAGRSSSPGGERAARRPPRAGRRPRVKDLGPHRVLSGNYSIREFPVASPIAEPIG